MEGVNGAGPGAAQAFGMIGLPALTSGGTFDEPNS